jgi:predicted transglutaminase-like cysteine proteinase
MASLERYLYDLEAASDEVLTGEGLTALPLTVSASGTCGVTTPEAGLPLPLPALAAEGSWLPVGVCPMPATTGTATQSAWRPAWGSDALPPPDVTGQASFALLVDLVLPPLFYEAQTGALGAEALDGLAMTAGTGAAAALVLPVPSPYGLSGLNRQASLSCALPRATTSAWSCSLDDPITNAAGSDDVVALLCQGVDTVGLVATTLAGGATLASVGADVLAGTLLAAVAENLAYAADADDDVWTCAMGTYTRGTGDCEDGAILLHGLLLAAGVAADRLVTVFGRVGVTRQGHAWLTYRRASDGNWVVLDWTADSARTAVASLPVIDDTPYYAAVDYALTAQAFFAVRQRTATFFPRACAVALTLPLALVAAEAALGGAIACDLGADWLGASALAASAGQAVLSRLRASATGGAARGAATLVSLTATSRTSLAASASLPAGVVSGQALGAWARSGLSIRPGLDGQAVLTGQGQAPVVLGRAQAAATGLCGTVATVQATGPRFVLAARAWPGARAWFETPFGRLSLTGLALGTDPGQGSLALPALTARTVVAVGATALTPYCWQTTSQERW